MINSHLFPVGFQHFGISLICLVAAAAATPSLLAAPLREPGRASVPPSCGASTGPIPWASTFPGLG